MYYYLTDAQNSSSGNNYVEQLVTELLKSAMYVTRMRFDRLQMADRKLIGDFIEVYVKIDK